MRTIIALSLLLLAPAPALAATTWTTDGTLPAYQAAVSKAVCTTGTESAPTLGTQGLDLWNLTGFAVHAEAAAAMTAGGKLLAYTWNPVTSRWNPAPDLDLVVSALQYQSFAGFQITAGIGRVAFVPSGVGQAVTIYVVGTPRRR
jgi:hypothetical protein